MTENHESKEHVMYINVLVPGIKWMDSVYSLFFYVEVFGFVCVPVCVWIRVTARDTKLIFKNRALNSSIGLGKEAPK